MFHTEVDVEGKINELDIPLETIFKLHCHALELYEKRKLLIKYLGENRLEGNEKMMDEIIELESINMIIDFGFEDIFPIIQNVSIYASSYKRFLFKPMTTQDLHGKCFIHNDLVSMLTGRTFHDYGTKEVPFAKSIIPMHLYMKGCPRDPSTWIAIIHGRKIDIAKYGQLSARGTEFEPITQKEYDDCIDILKKYEAYIPRSYSRYRYTQLITNSLSQRLGNDTKIFSVFDASESKQQLLKDTLEKANKLPELLQELTHSLKAATTVYSMASTPTDTAIIEICKNLMMKDAEIEELIKQQNEKIKQEYEDFESYKESENRILENKQLAFDKDCRNYEIESTKWKSQQESKFIDYQFKIENYDSLQEKCSEQTEEIEKLKDTIEALKRELETTKKRCKKLQTAIDIMKE